MENLIDLLKPLSRFLHEIGLLPLDKALSTKLSTDQSPGKIINHRLCYDIPFNDISFLLNLLEVQPFHRPKQSNSKSREDPVPRLLEILSQIALLPPFTLHVASHFSSILPELTSRWILNLEFEEVGKYSPQVCSYWSNQPEQNDSNGIERRNQSLLQIENIKFNLRLTFNAFGLLLPIHSSLFPLFVIFLRHPALATDPFDILPSETLVPISKLNEPLPTNHQLYQAEFLPQFLLSLYRLLLVAPHLPYEGLVVQGWVLSPILLNILKFHPHRGTRRLAWHCWTFWQGTTCSSQLSKDVSDLHVWQRNLPHLPAEGDLASPQSNTIAPNNSNVDHDSLIDPVIDSSPDDMIKIEDQLTYKWDVHLSQMPGKSTISYEIVSRVIDAWVLGVDETHKMLQLHLQSRSDPVEHSPDLPFLFLKNSHLSRLITIIEGHFLLKFWALPSPTSVNKISPVFQSQVHQQVAQTNATSHATPFVATSSSRAALRSFSELVTQRFPILLSGPPSSGKNTLVQHLAAHLWSRKPSFDHSTIDQAEFDQNVVILNLASRTLDAKSLVGSYVSSTEDPGKFVFVEGPLTRAMKEGKWLVCQDIDRASDDVLSVVNQLADLITHRAQYETGGGYGGHGGQNGVGIDLGAQSGWISANERFLLLATRTCHNEKLNFFTGEQHWKEVTITSMEKSDILDLVTQQTPNFSETVRNSLVSAWEEVSSLQLDSSRRRTIQLIDLLKWISRIQALLEKNQALNSTSQNPILQEQIFLEGIDLFLAFSDTLLVENDNLANNTDFKVAQALGRHIDLNTERSTYCICRRIPEYIPIAQKIKNNSHKKVKSYAKIGRIKQVIDHSIIASSTGYSRPFALTKSTLVLMERLVACMRSSEPILLVGETGTGKTSVVSYMARLVGKQLVSLNLSNQSEAGDLLGGFKPLDSTEDGKLQGSLLVDNFLVTFGEVFNTSRNQEFVNAARKAALKKKYVRLVALLKEGIRALSARLDSSATLQEHSSNADDGREPSKRRKTNSTHSKASDSNQNRLKDSLRDYLSQVSQFQEKFVKSSTNHMRFRFIEGPLVKALQNGDWVLLDEINLATTETLEALTGLLRHPNASVTLSERGDLAPILRHPEFRLIACMNPATDVGKRDLPVRLRSKFTEIYVQPPDNDREALLTIISQHLGGICASDKRAITDTADCYSAIRILARNGSLADGTNAPPHYSMRTLSRALTFATELSNSLILRRALVEGFLMAFVTTLDATSKEVVVQLIDRHLLQNGKNPHSIMSHLPKKPEDPEAFVQVGPFWLKKGETTDEYMQTSEYILTDSVRSKVIDLARAITVRQWPVLIQGPTSSGKTSIVAYLARLTGHSFVRINNHEHTDIQEYIGSYATDPKTGRLCFKEGVLVRALREGAWVVLDELNLAPSDVLEALNRLLDDNRELLIPETQEIVKPHPNFMLFATQNPPGLYGGRKVLSRAFRNRFLELHFNDVPKNELEIILCQRCAIAPSHAKKIVEVFVELQRRRQSDKIFEQKHSFVTLRDLFRWGGRGAVGYQELAEDGYMLLAERSRGDEEKQTVKQVLEELMKVTIDPQNLYKHITLPTSLVPTAASRRLFKLVSRCLQFNEPVLLVGDAGSGKTSVCEAVSTFVHQRLRSINLHRNSEVGDLLGSQRPIRQRAEKIQAALDHLSGSLALLDLALPTKNEFDIDAIVGSIEQVLTEKKSSMSDIKALDQAQAALDQLKKSTALFDWFDGPLIQAMQEGDHVLLDEISLADDSVLERLNSLLEPERSIVLAERGGGSLDQMHITAHEKFQILATMNPGGDFGKRELSPALRNRFTEIWVPLVSDPVDRLAIYSDRLSKKPTTDSFNPLELAGHIISFFEFYARSPISVHFSSRELSLRDGLAWCDFITSCQSLSSSLAFIHGAQMTVLDRIGTAGFGQDLPSSLTQELRSSCLNYLHELVKLPLANAEVASQITYVPGGIKIGDFELKNLTPTLEEAPKNYSFAARTVAHNAMRIIRALQVPKAVLLEGSPGVGKTSIVEALAKLSGKRLRRINLSDQTDLLDLFGADAPVEDGSPGQFAWKDASFLDALQNGDWVLLDEMNLAPQTVLEGLNGCLDHRGTVYIPEIDRTFQRHPHFKVFAAQNPHHQGGSRKGLPRSLVDRFTVVFMKEMEKEDLLQICTELAPDLDLSVISRMVNFNYRLIEETNKATSFASLGSPWEFNLRDLGRWLQITTINGSYDLQPLSPTEYIDMIYTGRFRTQQDQEACIQISSEFFDVSSMPHNHKDVIELPSQMIVGHSNLVKSSQISWTPPIVSPTQIPACLRSNVETLIRCLELKWLPILTGTERSGKTSLVKFLVARKGVNLRIISLHSNTDTSDIIGGFEQSSIEREFITILQDLCQAIQFELDKSFLCRDVNAYILEMSRRDLNYLKMLVFSCKTDKLLACALQTLKQLLDHPIGHQFAAFERSLLELQSGKSACRFEWVNGPLVTAMKNGEWLLVEDSNLCSASVLDRLNPLFEGAGTLQLAEKGMNRGQIDTVIPHDNFRIIFAFNPRYGELSRAMRNRGVEISFLSDYQLTIPQPSLRSNYSICPPPMIHVIKQFVNREEATNATPDDPVMRWTAHALIHSPSQYPLLSRVLDHFSPSQNPDQTLKQLLHRLLQPDVLRTVINWSQFNRASHYFFGEAFDLASANQLTGQLKDPINGLGHKCLLRLAIAACLPLHFFSQSHNATNTNDYRRHLSIFVQKSSDSTLNNCLMILTKLQEQGESIVDVTEYQILFDSMSDLQEGTLQLINLFQPLPDHAAIGFAVKMIEDALNQVPMPWKASFESARNSIQPLVASHNLSRWEAAVQLWDSFCPRWYKNSELLHLVQDLESLATIHWADLDTDLRSICCAMLASLEISDEISMQRPDVTILTEKLKKQISTTQVPKNDIIGSSPQNEDFGVVVEQLIGIVATMTSFLDPKQCGLKINALLPQWGSIPSHLGVLFRSKAYLEDHKGPTDQIDLCLNSQIVMSLTAPAVKFPCMARPSLEPINVLSQLSRSSFLRIVSNIVRSVKTSTSLHQHGAVVTLLNRVLTLLASTMSFSTLDREQLCNSLISNLVERIEGSIVHLHGPPPQTDINHGPNHSQPSLISRVLRLWRLYIPDVPIDPLSVQTARYAFLQAWMSRLSQLRQYLASYQMTRDGTPSNLRILLLDHEIQDIELRCRQNPPASIKRSSDTLILQTIFTELKAFETQFLLDDRLEDLAMAICQLKCRNNIPTLHSRLENFSFSAIGLIDRLSKRFPVFADILWPVQTLLHAIIADLTISFQNSSAILFNPSTQVMSDFVGILSTSTTGIAAAKLLENPPTEKLQEILAHEVSQSDILTLCISAMAKHSIKEFDDSQILRLLSFYDNLWQLWSRDCIRQAKEAEEKAQEFKTRRQDIIIKSDEEIEAEELQALFPSYEDNITIKPSAHSSSALFTPCQVSILCKLHFSITLQEFTEESSSAFDLLRQKIVMGIAEKQGSSLPSALDQSSMTFQFRTLHQLLNSASLPTNSKAKNFYTDQNIAESTRVIPIMTALGLRLEALIQQWPEMVVLQDILQRCQRIVALSSESPLALIIPQLEALINQIEEWQKYSCSENSLLSFQCDLTSLVVNWRRLELGSWATLIESEIDTFRVTTDSWWFRLYELLIRGYSAHCHDPDNPDAISYLRDCAVVINQFITDCNLGQFGSRLALIKSFRAFVNACSTIPDLGCWIRIQKLLDGIIYFYSHYEPAVKEKVKQAKKIARTEIENYIQLASWKDVNIIALRQSSQKSHRQLFKSVKKLRLVLQGALKDVLQRWYVKKSVDVDPQLPAVLQKESSFTSENFNFVTWNQFTTSLSMPNYFCQPAVILKRLENIVDSKTFLSEDAANAASEMDELSTRIFSVAKELREVKIPPGDGRERFARNLDLRKRKAFSELLKKLRACGIGTSPNDRVLNELKDPMIIMSQSLLGSEGLADVKSDCENSDEMLFGLLNEMTQFRQYRSHHHSDIANSDMVRLIGSVESGLALVLTERKTLSSLITAIKIIEESVLRMSDLLHCEALYPSELESGQLSGVCKKINQCQKLYGNCMKEASESIGELNDRRKSRGPTEIINAIRDMISSVNEHRCLVEDVAKASRTSLTLLKPSEVESFRCIDGNFQKAVKLLDSLALDFPDFDFILSPLSQQLGKYQIAIPNFNQADGHSSQKAWDALKKLTDSILVVIQDLAKKADNQRGDLKSNHDSKLLRKAHSEFGNLTEKLQLENHLQTLKKFNEVLSFASNSMEIFLLLHMATLLLKHYMRLVFEHLVDYLRWHRSHLRLLHTVVAIGANIAEQGFCKPDFSEDDESNGKDGPSKDGTGLGGGQGAKDVSDEIEDDEQLEGLQGEVEEEDRTNNQEEKKEDKAFETEHDFDGSLEDVEDAEDEEEPDDTEDKEEDEKIEDAVGNVDPLDSGAVDEKFWEGEDQDQVDADGNQADLSAKENKPMPKDSDLSAQENTAGGEQNKVEKADDPEVPSPEENGGSEIADNPSDHEGDEEDTDQQENAQENENNPELPGKDDTVPMMEHVDNSEVLDLPNDLELEDHGSEARENSANDSIMDHDDSVIEPFEENPEPETDNFQEDHHPTENNMETGEQEQPSAEALPQDNSSTEAQDSGAGSGTGTGGVGADSTPVVNDPTIDSDKNLDKEQSNFDDQKVAEDFKDSSANDQLMQDVQSQSNNQVGDGTEGQLSSREQKSINHSEEVEKEPSRPNPLRNLGNAMEDWKQRLQQIIDASPEDRKNDGEERFDDTAEVEYLQTDDVDVTSQQAPGPATEEQACQGLVNMQIDDCEPEIDVQKSQPSNLMPRPVDLFQPPETGDQNTLAEPAILGSRIEPQDVNNGEMLDSHFEEDLGDDDQQDQDDLVQTIDLECEDALMNDPSALTTWQQYLQLTQRPASQLTEQLRLILEPTTATRLQGDYRTGKRLNMRKLVPYIASDYTKDRIWLRRTKPAQRDYEILLAVDDSRSMADSRCADLAFRTLALVTSALSKLEVGEVAIAKFGSTFDVLQPFGGIVAKSANSVSPIDGFTFAQPQTNVRLAVAKAIETFSLAHQSGSNSSNDTWKLGIIISDGICQDHGQIRALLRKAINEKIMFVFLILDSLHQHAQSKTGNQSKDGSKNRELHQPDSSIISMNSVSYVNGSNGQMELKMERYLDTFPFDYYIILRDVEALPNILSSTLRQFFEKVNHV